MKSDNLSKIVQYASHSQQSSRKMFLIHGGLILVASVSPITYVKPSYADTPPYGLPPAPSIKSLQVISTWLPTTALLYLACLDFMQARMQRSVPEELEGILDGMSQSEMRCQDWGIVIISLLSAIPLTTPLVKYPLIATGDPNKDIPANAILVSIILGANGVAHLRPLQVINDNPWYGFPITIIKFFTQLYQECRLTPEEKAIQQTMAQKIKRNSELNSHLTQMVAAKKTQLIDDCFVRRGWGYDIQLSDDFNRIYRLSDDTLITELAEYGKTSTPQATAPITWKQNAYYFFLKSISNIAALLALGESIGYLGDSGIELSKLTGNSALGWTLAGVPIWAFGVLIHNAARVLTEINVDFAIDFIRGKQTLSWPIKYCAKTFFGALFPPSILLMLLNSSAANVMIRADLDGYCSDNFIDNYIGVFRWGFVWLATLLMIDLERYSFTQWAKHFGNDEARKIAHFDAKMNNVIARLSQWKGEQLQAWLADQTPKLRGQLLNITEERYQELSDTQDEQDEKKETKIYSLSPQPPKQQQTTWAWISSIFCCKKSDEAQPLLDEKSRSDSIGSPITAAINIDPRPTSSWWNTLCCWKRPARQESSLRASSSFTSINL